MQLSYTGFSHKPSQCFSLKALNFPVVKIFHEKLTLSMSPGGTTLSFITLSFSMLRSHNNITQIESKHLKVCMKLKFGV